MVEAADSTGSVLCGSGLSARAPCAGSYAPEERAIVLSGRIFDSCDKSGLLTAGICILTVLLLLASLWVTGAPYSAAGIVMAVPVIAWSCMKPKRLVYLLVVYCCLYPYLISNLGLPSFLSYGGDLITVLALFFALRSYKLRDTRWGWVPVPLVMFALVSLVTAIIHAISPILMLWETRNVFRFFAFLVVCVGLLDVKDIKNILKLLFVVFVVNLFLCTFEFLVLHYGQDNTNGLFGSGSGGNAATNILLLEMTCLVIFGYGRKVVTLPILLLVVAGSCWVSIIAELKFYFVQLAILIVLYVLVSRPSIKNVLLVAGLLFGLYFAIQAFYAFMPGWDNYFDLKTLVASNTEGGYGTADGLNRLSAVETIRGLFMTDPASQLFGLGFGAGTYSQFFAAPLYSAWGEVLHWTWFTDAQLFLETGYVGLICYGLFFIGLGVRGLCTRRGSNGEEAVFMEAGAVMGLFCVLLMFYNCALTVDPGGYLIFLFLAMPLVTSREHRGQKCEKGTAVEY